MKCLIAVTPNGAACFIGSIDDVTLFERCGILEHINQGDALLVDKGFTIQDILLKKQATIFIPPFLGKRSAFTKEEELLTKRIAQARIHVERFNERLKKFRLISNVIPLNLASLASQLVMWHVALLTFNHVFLNNITLFCHYCITLRGFLEYTCTDRGYFRLSKNTQYDTG